MTNLLDYCLHRAKDLPEDYRQRLYCCITDKRGKILAEAGNSFVKTSPWQYNVARQVGHPDRQYLHAEVAALLRLQRSRIGGEPYKLTVARLLRNGQAGNAKPCAVCERAVKMFPSIKVIEYST